MGLWVYMFISVKNKRDGERHRIASDNTNRWRFDVEDAIFGLALIWFITLFSAWDLAQTILGVSTHFGISSESFSSFSEKTSWLPLAAEVARGNILPSQPSLATGANGLSFLPYLSVWVQGLFIALFGVQNTQIIGSILFPAACFSVLVLIYREYIPLRWSIALAALGLISFAGFPFREFLIHLLLGQGWAEQGVLQPPDIASFPLPAFSLLMFLLAFRSSVRRVYLTPMRISALTVFWALQSQVHAVNVVFGLPLWFLILGMSLWRRERGGNISRTVSIVAVQVLFAVVLCIPAMIGYLGAESLQGGAHTLLSSPSRVTESLFGAYFYIAYFLMPLALMTALYFFLRFDIYEALYKFWPVLLTMVLEFFLVNLYLFFNIGVPSELVFTRLGLFFLHLFYYVPIIYYLSRETESNGIATDDYQARGRRPVLVWLMRDASKIYIPIGLLFLTLYGLASAVQAFNHAETLQRPGIIEARSQMATLTQGAPLGSTLVSDSAAVNLMLPVEGGYGTLWVNRFANRITATEAVDRLALSGRLLGWSEDKFARFMSPDPQNLLRPGLVINLESDNWPTGLGYWLAFHWQSLSDTADRAAFEANIRKIYLTLDVPAAVERFNVRVVLSKGVLPAEVRVQAERLTAYGTLYEIRPLQGSGG